MSKSSEHCWGDFLPGGENLRRSDFDDSEIVNTEHQLKSKLV